MRDFNLSLAEAVRDVRRKQEFALVIGGDCSILMGALAGAREEEPLALIHVDGHSDFRHPGNYDFGHELGAAAGMDLALVTGRGDPLGTEWPGIVGPLVADADVIQLGERESRDMDFAWPDVADTAIGRISLTFSGMVVRACTSSGGTVKLTKIWLVLPPARAEGSALVRTPPEFGQNKTRHLPLDRRS